MTDKLLTIIIPAYNAQKYLRTALDAFTAVPGRDRLDVIVVNDGSTDGTEQLAREYCGRFPRTVRVLNKENGGHGSAINAGAQAAEGKYVKVVDADDWIEPPRLEEFLGLLETAEADIIAANYHTVHMQTGHVADYVMEGVPYGGELPLEEFLKLGRGAWSCCTFHGLCYRAEFYRQSGCQLPEKVFYEDQEYATLPFFSAKSIMPVDLFLYEYLIGNQSQSVSDENMAKRIGHQETVLLDTNRRYLAAEQSLSRQRREYALYKLSGMLLGYYATALLREPCRPKGREEAAGMRARMAAENPPLERATRRGYGLFRALHALRITNRRMEAVKASGAYRSLKKIIH